MKILPSNDINSLYEKITKAGNVLIAVHSHPDGDAVGSCVALLSWFRETGVRARAVMSDRFPDFLDFLTDGCEPDDIIFFDENRAAAEEAVRKSGLIVFLDMNHPSRAGEGLAEILDASPAEKVLIDHHPDPKPDYFSLMFSETEISSASELLYHILKAMPGVGRAENLPPSAARALMTGMTTDTNNFANSVFPTTLSMASELMEAGVDRDGIVSRVFNSYSPDRIRLMGLLLDRRLKITPDGVAYMILSLRTAGRFCLKDGDTEGLVNIPLTAKGVLMSIFLREEKDRFRVSIRSRRGISAKRCAERYFRGGGHEMAAGGRLLIPEDVANVKEAAAYIEESTRRFFKENPADESE